VVLLGVTRNLLFAYDHRYTLGCYNLEIDSGIYRDTAKALAEGSLLDVPLSHPPGYLWMLAVLYRMTGVSLLAPKIAFCLMIAVLAVGVYLVGRRLLSPAHGVVAGALVSFSPLLSAYAATLQYEIAASFTLWLAFSFAFAAVNSTGRVRSLVAVVGGIACGYAALTRETSLLAAPVLAGWIYRSCRAHSGDAGQSRRLDAILFLLPIVVIVGGWIVTQYIRTGMLVPISSKGGINFALGNNPSANGTFNLTAIGAIPEMNGLPFILAHPLDALHLVLRRLLYFFGILKDGWNVPHPGGMLLSAISGGVIPLREAVAIVRGIDPALACAGALMLVVRRRDDSSWILVALVLSALLAPLITISSVRFSIPVAPYLALLAAVPLVSVGGALLRNWKVCLVSGVVVSVLGVLGSRSVSERRYEPGRDAVDGVGIVEEVEGRLTISRGAPRVAVVLTEEFLEAGYFVLTFTLHAEGAIGAKLGEVSFSVNEGTPVCAMAVRYTGPQEDRIEVPCYLPRAAVVKSLLSTLGTEEWGVRGLAIRYGLEADRVPPLEGMVFGPGWHREERWPDGAPFRWASGGESVVLVPLRRDGPGRLDLAALPVSMKGAVQRVTVEGPLGSGGSVVLPRDVWSGITLPLPQGSVEGVPAVVRFHHTRSLVPSDLGGSRDTRSLAAAYRGFTIREGVEAGSNGGVSR
jgi:4-amino-4-deoxy-L-arabinose transferase-like glycosyltransferase